MNSSRRKIATILEALGVPPSARRSAATPAAPACESLEGRQLLAGDLGLAGMGALGLTGLGLGAADVSAMPGGWGGGAGLGGAAMGQGAMAPGMGSNSGSGLSSTKLQADMTKLQADTQMIQDQSLVTPQMSSKVDADLAAVKSAETTTANPAFLANLQAATKSIDSTPGGPTLGQAFGLEIDENVVYLSQGVSTSLIDQLDADRATVAAATGITPAQEFALTNDQAVVTTDQAAMMPVAVSTPTVFAPYSVGSRAAAMPAATGSTTMNPMAWSPAGQVGQPSPGPTGSTTVAPTAWAPSAKMGELAAAGANVLLPPGGAGMSMMNDTGILGLGLQSTPTGTTAAETTLINDRATMKADVQTLQGELKTIDATSTVTPAMQAVVRNDLMAVKGAASASPGASAVATLKSDMMTALTNGGGPTANQISQVYTDEAAVYASEGVNPALVQKLQSAQQAILSASGITGAEEGALYADQQAVEADMTKVRADIKAIAPATTTTVTTGGGTTTTSAAIPDGPAFGQGFGNLGGPGGFMP